MHNQLTIIPNNLPDKTYINVDRIIIARYLFKKLLITINNIIVRGLLLDLRLIDTRVFLVGGSGVIGSAIAAEFLNEGAKVFLCGRNHDKVEKAVTALNADSLKSCSGTSCNLEDDASIQSAVAAARDFLKGIDIVVNCAGIGEMAPVESMTRQSWDKVLRVNLTSAFLVSQKVFPEMKTEKNGVIINIASFAGKRGTLFGDNVSYSASKGGLLAFTNALAIEGAPHNVRVVTVSPGVVHSPMLEGHKDRMNKIREKIPLGRLGDADEMAGVVVFLSSFRASYITGENVNVNGGLFMDF